VAEDLVEARCSRRETLEHLCFRVEEWVYDYAVNTSLKVEDDHPTETTFAVGIYKVLLPPPLHVTEERPAVAAEMENHWDRHYPDRTPLGSLLSHPEEQELCFTGDWFAATHHCQGLVLCCGPKLRRLPPSGYDDDGNDAAALPEAGAGDMDLPQSPPLTARDPLSDSLTARGGPNRVALAPLAQAVDRGSGGATSRVAPEPRSPLGTPHGSPPTSARRVKSALRRPSSPAPPSPFALGISTGSSAEY
jgi:hypothetical protein